MKTAEQIAIITDWSGDARLFKLDPPLDGHAFVIVSAVNAPYSGPETYIFPATGNGKVVDFGELEGSYRGGRSHVTALENAGYTVIGKQGN